ncbi:MAG: hypothetical protein HOH43_04675 [Candidatus Latescibacteria bacterium]|nr:hypothetical protein [Candidatus Latescibacterota bacterium]
MKLLIVIVNKRDIRRLSDALVDTGFRFTKIGSTGGFVGEGNDTLLLGVADADVEPVIDIIRAHCQSREEPMSVAQPGTRIDANPLEEAISVPVGGAQVFVLNVEQVVQV